MNSFTSAELDRLRERGIPAEEAERQLALLREPPPRRRLDRPANVGDGIVRIPEESQAELIQLAELAARQGRCLKFVPASGAASRMFATLLAARAARQCDVHDLVRLGFRLPLAMGARTVARLQTAETGQADSPNRETRGIGHSG